MTRLRLLTIGRSYTVGMNRRLAHALAEVGGATWDVTCVAPRSLPGDYGPLRFATESGEPCRVYDLPVLWAGRPHTLGYRDLPPLLAFDLVHAWEEPFVLAGWQIGRASRGVPFVFTTCQNLGKWYPPPFSWFERSTVTRAAGWTGIGETVVETLLKRPGYADRPHAAIPLGVDRSHFRPDRVSGLTLRTTLGWTEPGPPVIGYLGRFVPEKGLDQVMKLVEQFGPRCRALLVGGGPLTEAVQRWGASQGERVRVVTGVIHAEVPRYLNAMDLLLAPSRTTPRWREQFGRMIVEAMACGIPVIGSDSGEIPRVIQSAGIIVPEADDHAWQEAVGRLIENPNLRQEYAGRGLERARHFDWSVVAGEMLQLFEKARDEGRQ